MHYTDTGTQSRNRVCLIRSDQGAGVQPVHATLCVKHTTPARSAPPAAAAAGETNSG